MGIHSVYESKRNSNDGQRSCPVETGLRPNHLLVDFGDGKSTNLLTVVSDNGEVDIEISNRIYHTPDLSMPNDFTSRVTRPLFDCRTMDALDFAVLEVQQPVTKHLGLMQLLEVESGNSMIISRRRDSNGNWIITPDETFFQQHHELSSVKTSSIDLRINNEVGILGGAWRGFLLRFLLLAMDNINALQLSRILQIQIHFQTGLEAFVTAHVIDALDHSQPKEVSRAFKVAFRNRNVSRIIVQNLTLRFDFLWHWNTAIRWNRLFDALGQFPVVGITSFPATENFPSTRNHALASIFHVLLGQGNWLTRVITGGREGLITDDPENTAQNLAAESNNFELANRNQYGTYFGRVKTNEFRFAHRLPTDESLVRSFVSKPIPTMTNNGVVHVLRQLAKHWYNVLNQRWGNFAHQRMEQLDPFETLRFHIPRMLLTLSSLRGRNQWDAKVLGPVILSLQQLEPCDDIFPAYRLIEQLRNDIVIPVCGGVASMVDPFLSWLDAIAMSLPDIEREAQAVYDLVASVEFGIRVSYDVMSHVDWEIPSDDVLKHAIIQHIRDEPIEREIDRLLIVGALQKTTPRDKRTIIELIQKQLDYTKPAQLLLCRVKTLLQREIRRSRISRVIQRLSKGRVVCGNLEKDQWYWVLEGDEASVCIYVSNLDSSVRHLFIHVDSGLKRIVRMDGSIEVRCYIPIAEGITRAQKVFMIIELDYGKRFAYSAFMEFKKLRVALRRLNVISQMACVDIDNARLNLLREIQRSKKLYVKPHEMVPGRTYFALDKYTQTYKPFVMQEGREAIFSANTRITNMPPQSVLVVGGGPAGLISVIHCAENCLASGGIMKLYEARDAFAAGGSTFERAQIVRLDARWIAMMRYHLGTTFEDVFIPASGETDAQLGNTLPSEGFVEITIKDLESILHLEVSRLWSRGVISVYTDSKANFDISSNCLVKLGKNLKVDDLILRRVDKDGNPSDNNVTWRVKELVHTKSLEIDDLKVGAIYGIWIPKEQQVLPFQLVKVCLDTKAYVFHSLSNGVEHLEVHPDNLPSIYPSGADKRAHASVEKVVLECTVPDTRGKYLLEEKLMNRLAESKFILDVIFTHVIEAIGKPKDCQTHFQVTTAEPYGVCCMQGLKVSMGMHNFGEKRWGSGIVDDVRSQNDQNTRIIGDFTKMVRVAPILTRMHSNVTEDKEWILQFQKIANDSGFPRLNADNLLLSIIADGCSRLVDSVRSFHRSTLQTRFFETGDNYYLGMEFPREYDSWKTRLIESIVSFLSIESQITHEAKQIDRLKRTLSHYLDRLWYDGCLETIRTGDVYNPGARRRVPRLYLIDSQVDVPVASLPTGESFRLSKNTRELYEILVKRKSDVICRNVQGFISILSNETRVRRESNLSRSPDGNTESKVSLSTFTVAHLVNHRTMRVSNKEMGYVFAFMGDEQATPHFMRYSGLTGAGINAMSFNIFLEEAIAGKPFVERYRRYSMETDWSNGEVVQRGTGGNYGEDGFLRPGFSYQAAIKYLYAKVLEYHESDQDTTNILSYDWKVKFASSLIPRGLECNVKFLLKLRYLWRIATTEKFIDEISKDRKFSRKMVILKQCYLEACESSLDSNQCWDNIARLFADESVHDALSFPHIYVAQRVDSICLQVIHFAKKAYKENTRVSSELFNQPKPVDSIIDDFAVEAQSFANSLTQSAALASAALSFRLLGSNPGNYVSAILSVLNIFISFGTMANVARYKIRNEEARVVLVEKKIKLLKKDLYSMINENGMSCSIENPFVTELQEHADKFRLLAEYYGYQDTKDFNSAMTKLLLTPSDAEVVVAFQSSLLKKFIADTYHVNSYLQESLVDIYRATEELLTCIKKRKNGESCRCIDLYQNLLTLESKLNSSLQRGPVRWGFVKQRSFKHWDISTSVRYVYSVIFLVLRGKSSCMAPIQIEILSFMMSIQEESNKHESKVLRRGFRDVEDLYWSTRESDIASLVFLSGFLVFAASIIFTLARIFRIALLQSISFWTNTTSAFGAILAIFHFYRKLAILVKLLIVLQKRPHAMDTEKLDALRVVRALTITQILLTGVRLFTAIAASIALPWAVAQNGYGNKISPWSLLPFWIAFVALILAIGSTFLFFIVEYVLRYTLPTNLGPFVCELFRDEIEAVKEAFSYPVNSIDTEEVQERIAWEYTARHFLHEFRFDTVFAADRFGQILQYIQAGMKRRGDFIEL